MSWERSAGFVYDTVHTRRQRFPKDYAADAVLLHGLLQDLKIPERTLLDVACGTGLHLTKLATHYRVAGVDLSPAMVAYASKRVPGGDVTIGNMLDFQLGRQFGAVFCGYGSIAFAIGHERLREAIANLAKHVAPNGWLVIEPWLAPGRIRSGNLRIDVVDEDHLKITRITRATIEDGVSELDMQYTVGRPTGIEVFREVHRLGLYTPKEYLSAFQAAGLTDVNHVAGVTSLGFHIGRVSTA